MKKYYDDHTSSTEQVEEDATLSSQPTMSKLSVAKLDPVLEVGYKVLQEYKQALDYSYKQMLPDFMGMLTKTQATESTIELP